MGYPLVVVLYTAAIAPLLYSMISGEVQLYQYHSSGQAVLSGLSALLTLALAALPAYLAFARWRAVRAGGEMLLTHEYRRARRVGYVFGQFLIWAGHLSILFSVSLMVLVTYRHVGGIPAGLGVGLGLSLYWWAILCIEISVRRWKRIVASN
jgi:hypothetical protein